MASREQANCGTRLSRRALLRGAYRTFPNTGLRLTDVNRQPGSEM